MSSNRYRAVFLSPHLDDAVLSCGAEMARLRAEGPLLVINLFTGFRDGPKSSPVPMGDLRFDEERAASRQLGFESVSLGELDAFFREKEYRSVSKIFLRPSPWIENALDAFAGRLATRLGAALDGLAFDRIYVPLGVGWHVDHTLTFLAFQMLETGRAEVLYYEDAPYCLIEGAVEARLAQLGGSRWSLAAFSRLWWRAALSFWGSGMVQTMRPAALRYLAFPVTSAYLLRLLRGHLAQVASSRKLRFSPCVSAVDAEFDSKMQGIECYGSQIRQFFVNPDQMRRSYRSYSKAFRAGAGYGERYWIESAQDA